VNVNVDSLRGVGPTQGRAGATVRSESGRTPPAGTTPGGLGRSHAVSVRSPYRLDLTASVLRRLSTNLVDVLTPDGEYVRVLSGIAGPAIVRARQVGPDTLAIAVEGDARDHAAALATARRVLGVEIDLRRFYRSAARVRWLWPLVRRMRGVKPPRYPTVWEACANAIVFQQISLIAASAIMSRIVVALGQCRERDGVRLYCFPGVEQVQGADDATLRAAGLSAGKLATLRRVGDTIGSGVLDEAVLEEHSTPAAAALLRGIKGIGPWTAAVILLRGLGRLDVFPANDTSVGRNLAFVRGSAPFDLEAVLDALGPDRGMLYYHLLLARLEARGDIGRASVERRA